MLKNTVLFKKSRYMVLPIAAAVTITLGLVSPGVSLAACQAPNTDFGSATSTLSVPETASYRIWSRMQATTTANSSFAIEIDGNTCLKVGGNVAAGSWKWVDYQNSNTASKTDFQLNKGNHTLKLIGLGSGVKLDRVMVTSDLGCVPTSKDGKECDVPNDATAPTVHFSAPQDGATVSGNIDLTATASDNTAVAKVVFLLDNAVLATVVNSPYTYKLDAGLYKNGNYTLTARAFDAAGNSSGDQRTITVKNGDTEAPTAPTGASATANSNSQITLSWKASTDNASVTGYSIWRNGAPLATVVGNTFSYVDKALSANTTYTYRVTANDAAGNISEPSNEAKATTTNPADTQAPSRPAGAQATAVSTSQINLAWKASTDNIGVKTYDVYRQTGISPAQKVGSTSSTNFGDTTLKAKTTYTYTVKAIDATGNISEPSTAVSATTKEQPSNKNSQLIGTIRDRGGKAIPYSKVSLMIDGKLQTFSTNSKGQYDIDPIAGGQYTLTYSAKGYRTNTISRNINPNARVNQNATLER